MFTFAKEINMTPDVLETAQGDSLLEKLQAALVSLDRYRFYFPNWHQCTCGHIYRAAMGRGTNDESKVLTCEDDRFRALLEVVLWAHDCPTPPGWTVDEMREEVSSLTIRVGDAIIADEGHDRNMMSWTAVQPYRKRAAVQIIERAIAFETGRNERARLALLGS